MKIKAHFDEEFKVAERNVNVLTKIMDSQVRLLDYALKDPKFASDNEVLIWDVKHQVDEISAVLDMYGVDLIKLAHDNLGVGYDADDFSLSAKLEIINENFDRN